MLHVPGFTRANWTYDNFGATPAVAYGTSVTPGASNAEGTWTQIASSANIAQDVRGFWMMIHTGSFNGEARPQLTDIGVDPAGGTSYTAVISNIPSGCAATDVGHAFFFPLFIKSGSTVAVRGQVAAATARTFRCAAKFYGYLSDPSMWKQGYFSETIGTVTNSDGTSFTPGNNADGSWTSLGTTTQPLWWWQIGVQVNNATITAETCLVELAYGDGSNKVTICKRLIVGSTSETTREMGPTQTNMLEAYSPVPGGSTIYIRGRALNAPDTGYNAMAIGIGG